MSRLPHSAMRAPDGVLSKSGVTTDLAATGRSASKPKSRGGATANPVSYTHLDGDNWPYDALCERQKRRGVRLSQYLTPDATARRIATLAVRYFENDSRIMDVCCGTDVYKRQMEQ